MTQQDKSREELIELVRRCLALSRSSNENEAARAAEKAAELMLKFKISEAEAELDSTTTAAGVTYTTYPGVNRMWRRSLTNAVAMAFFCRTVGFGKGSSAGVYFVGKPTEVEVAIMTYEWLSSALDDICYQSSKNDMGERGSLVRWRNSWLTGAVAEVGHRFFDMRKNQAAEAMAVMVSSRKEVEEFIADKWHLVYRKNNSTPVNQAAYQEGREAGKSVPLSRPTGIEGGKQQIS